MKTFNRAAAQGEVRAFRLDEMPTDVAMERLPLENGQLILGHSETGHHHVMDPTKVEAYRVTEGVPEGMTVLNIIVKEPTSLDHLRAYNTHESVMFEAGTYRITTDREYTPEGYRRVAD